MNPKILCVSFCAACGMASAVTRYVDLNCPTPTAPYTNWATAATTIQDAINAATINDTVLVTNGIYSSGGTLKGGLTNRVVLKQITLQSVNGPESTVIQGYQVPGVTNGDAAIRCVYVTGAGVLSGFTITGGATLGAPNGYGFPGCGGGIFDGGTFATVTNCVIVGNAAFDRGGGTYGSFVTKSVLTRNSATYGGGAYGGDLNTCRVFGNSAFEGGGANNGSLHFCEVRSNTAIFGGGVFGDYSLHLASASFCTITGNSARSGGGVNGVAVDNSIVVFNKGCGDDGNQTGSTFDHSCTPMLPGSSTGLGNISTDPQLASASHLSASSPCRGAGIYPYGFQFTDNDGDSWGRPPSIGCDEYIAGSVTGDLSVAIGSAYTNVTAGFELELTALIDGRTSGSGWDFGDGSTMSNRPYATHAWATPGSYNIVLTAYNETYPKGVRASLNILVEATPIHYVDAGSTNPVEPYSSWETAAADIQSAVDAANVPGELVLVNDGVFDSGRRAVYGTMTNRVVIDKPVRVQSVSGPDKTFIIGAQAHGGGCGDGAIRCVYLADGAILSGFTLTNGATRASGDAEYEKNGGAVWCASPNGVVSNCVLAGNCALGGGAAYGGFVVDSLITSNSTTNDGGGATLVSLANCVISGNSATGRGGATCSSLLRNCTVVGNLTRAFAGAVDLSTSENSIVFNNTNATGQPMNWSLGSINNCCTVPLAAGNNNFTNDPLFIDWASGNLRLQSNSPCINAGQNAFVSTTTDLDGKARIVGGTVDVGAYEFETPLSRLSYAWLQSYGLATDGSADLIDSDGDGFSNWQEFTIGADPTNAASGLRMVNVSPASAGVTVTWQSVTNRNYFLERSTDPVKQNSFSRIASNLAGGQGTTSFTDTNAPKTRPVFYRVGTKLPQP